jgi:hypothetical protein
MVGIILLPSAMIALHDGCSKYNPVFEILIVSSCNIFRCFRNSSLSIMFSCVATLSIVAILDFCVVIFLVPGLLVFLLVLVVNHQLVRLVRLVRLLLRDRMLSTRLYNLELYMRVLLLLSNFLCLCLLLLYSLSLVRCHF